LLKIRFSIATSTSLSRMRFSTQHFDCISR
jgi:hypothetical protein